MCFYSIFIIDSSGSMKEPLNLEPDAPKQLKNERLGCAFSACHKLIQERTQLPNCSDYFSMGLFSGANSMRIVFKCEDGKSKNLLNEMIKYSPGGGTSYLEVVNLRI